MAAMTIVKLDQLSTRDFVSVEIWKEIRQAIAEREWLLEENRQLKIRLGAFAKEEISSV